MRRETIFAEWSPPLGAPELTDEVVAEAQIRLGFTLPTAYIDLLKVQNGGILKPNSISLGNGEFTGVGMFYGLGGYDGIDAE